MMRNDYNRSGFTLVEIAVASSIFVIAISMACVGFTFFLRSSNLSRYQNELDTEVQTAMERIKYDLRLSSLDEIYYYPAGPGPYSAISFPMARDDDGDGAIDMDENNKIIWDRTLVYHVWTTTPQQLRLTIFDPRDNTLTESQRQAQLDGVVTAGHGDSTYNGQNANTHVVFENLFDWALTPRSSTYDAYSETLERDINRGLGSLVLSPGAHQFEFSVVGRHADSSGFKIGVDAMQVSPSGGKREAEDQLPVVRQSGAVASKQERTSGSWSGNHHLYFPATASGHKFTLSMGNDRWEETNFGGLGHRLDDAEIEYDSTLSPHDFIVRLAGYGFSWYAFEQTAATNVYGSPAQTGFTETTDRLRGCAVRVLVRGSDMESGGWIKYSGGRSWVWFTAGGADYSQQLKIDGAYISECSTDEMSPNVIAGTTRQLAEWPGGATTFTLAGSAGTWTYSIGAPYAIDRDKSYVISYLVSSLANHGCARYWPECMDPSKRGSFILQGGTAADLTAANWTSKTNLVVDTRLFAIQYVYTSFPASALYTSQIYDTALDTPSYGNISWSSAMPSGTYLGMKVRSGSDPQMYGATAWSNIVAITTPAAINPGNGRYVQFQAELHPDASDGFSTPKLKTVTIAWTGQERLVDVAGTFTRGPDYGTFKLLVDGRELKTGVNVDLTIFQDVRGQKGEQRITSGLVAEIVPRNTGR